jgi:DNA-binding protein
MLEKLDNKLITFPALVVGTALTILGGQFFNIIPVPTSGGFKTIVKLERRIETHQKSTMNYVLNLCNELNIENQRCELKFEDDKIILIIYGIDEDASKSVLKRFIEAGFDISFTKSSIENDTGKKIEKSRFEYRINPQLPKPMGDQGKNPKQN